MTEVQGFHWSLIVNCVFNAFFSYAAVMLNIVTMRALRKTSSLPNPLKTLLLSLAVSDLGVGLRLQPLYIKGLVMMSQYTEEDMPAWNNTDYAFAITVNLFYYASFFGVTALCVERFLAIHLHLRYQELVTHKRVVAAVISIWVFSALLSLIRLWTPDKVRFVIFSVIEVSCLITTALLYCKIFAAVRRHTNQIQALQVQEVGETLPNIARQKKSAVSTFYVYLVFLACYLPENCILVADISTGYQNTLVEHFTIYTQTLVFLNSSLNPLIYSWKMRHIRHAIKDMLPNFSLQRSCS